MCHLLSVVVPLTRRGSERGRFAGLSRINLIYYKIATSFLQQRVKFFYTSKAWPEAQLPLMAPILTTLRSLVGIDPLVVAVSAYWLYRVNAVVPMAYLDEMFHWRQVRVYWMGFWDVYDPKITTPAGLYLWSYALLVLASKLGLVKYGADLKTAEVRWTSWGLHVLGIPWEVMGILSRIGSGGMETGEALETTLHAVSNVVLFPPIFFFAALYYTDLLSLFVVLRMYNVHLQMVDGKKRSLAASIYLYGSFIFWGLSSLLVRQTNIFWTAVFLGGLTVVHQVKQSTRQCTASDWSGIVGSLTDHQFYDPLVSEASIQGTLSARYRVYLLTRPDYLKTTLSLGLSAVLSIRSVLPSLLPHFSLLAAFGAFVIRNGGVALGHQEYHTAGLHVPQMLYIWAYFVFFSWPVVLPHFVALLPQGILPSFLRQDGLTSQRPGVIIAIAVTAAMGAAVHFNTIIHPFTLADNRHYVFYVFKIFRQYPIVKYLLTPVYFVSAWACIAVLGGTPPSSATTATSVSTGATPTSSPASSLRRKQAKPDLKAALRSAPSAPSWSTTTSEIRVSFVLIWLIATTLCLVTAPLVEPRYYIIPWVIWRMHVNVPLSSASKTSDAPAKGGMLHTLRTKVTGGSHDYKLWVETGWYLAVNAVTCWIFLNKGFTWKSEPGKVQRFMW